MSQKPSSWNGKIYLNHPGQFVFFPPRLLPIQLKFQVRVQFLPLLPAHPSQESASPTNLVELKSHNKCLKMSLVPCKNHKRLNMSSFIPLQWKQEKTKQNSFFDHRNHLKKRCKLNSLYIAYTACFTNIYQQYSLDYGICARRLCPLLKQP